MRLKAKLFVVICGFCCSGLFAQHAVDPSQRYFRLVCLVHLTGSGRTQDPVRPEYAPQALASGRHAILAWAFQPSDDGKMAILQLAAADHAAFNAILADKRPEIRVFEIGRTPVPVIEAEMQKYKKDFTLAGLEVLAQ